MSTVQDGESVTVQFGDAHSATPVISGTVVGQSAASDTTIVDLDWTLSDGKRARAYVVRERCKKRDAGGSSAGIPFAAAFKVLANRSPCDHEHGARHFYDGKAPTHQEAESANSKMPEFDEISKEDVRELSPVRLLAYLLKVQQTRVTTYRYFDDVFRQLLKTRNFTPYRLACDTITKQFAVLSGAVRLVRECLAKQDLHEVCKSITLLQAAEKRKLETTAQLQLLQQHLSLREHGTESQSAHTHPQQCEEVSTSDLVDAVRLQKVTLSEIVDNINDIVEDLQCEHVNLA